MALLALGFYAFKKSIVSICTCGMWVVSRQPLLQFVTCGDWAFLVFTTSLSLSLSKLCQNFLAKPLKEAWWQSRNKVQTPAEWRSVSEVAFTSPPATDRESQKVQQEAGKDLQLPSKRDILGESCLEKDLEINRLILRTLRCHTISVKNSKIKDK